MSPPAVPAATFLLGPTASGKTSLSLALSEHLGAEIVCLDSMQVYRGFPIASAQPTAEERSEVPHHLFESVGLDEVYDAGRFVVEAVAVAREVRGRGRGVLFVGGTVLYYKALVEGLADLPARDPELRRELRASWDSDGGERLRAELQRVDPEAAGRIDRNDYRRTERALEVYRLTGSALSVLHRRPTVPALEDAGTLCLRPPRDWLRARVEARQQEMIAAGLVEEMRGLWELFREVEEPPTALQAIGYRHMAAYFEGEQDLEAALTSMRTDTNRLVRHQETWLRKLGRGTDLDPSREGLLERAREALETAKTTG